MFCVTDVALSSAAKKRDSNLLFASSSTVFENFFSQHLPTCFLCLNNSSLRDLLSAAKRRDFDLLSQHRQVLSKNFFFSVPGDFFKPTRTFQPASLISNYSPLPACSAVISEAHDCSTGFLRRTRRSAKLFEGPAFRLHTYRAFGAKRLAPCHIYVAPSSSVGPKDCRLNAQQARCVSWSSLCRPSPWGLRC